MAPPPILRRRPDLGYLPGPRRVLLLVLITVLAGCRDTGMAPCLHTYDDPVLTVSSAVDTESWENIPQIRLRGIRINGIPTHPEAVSRRGAFNVSVDDDALLCDAPCGFGTVEGVYDFSARAPAYEWTRFRTVARYHTFVPGCPSRDADGDSVAVELTPP